jgi:vacuolar-type H+-ATPase subunit D/Vma8
MKLVFIVCLISAVILGCAKPPLAEMESARAAVFRAQADANAAAFAADSLARAQDALRRMNTEADNKRYDAARTNANEAIQAAEKAIADGKLKAGMAKEEAASLVAGLRPEIEETSRNVNGARYSQLNLDFRALDGQLKNAHDAADMAEADQIDGKYRDAIDRARGVRADLADINQKVSNAVPRKK